MLAKNYFAHKKILSCCVILGMSLNFLMAQAQVAKSDLSEATIIYDKRKITIPEFLGAGSDNMEAVGTCLGLTPETNTAWFTWEGATEGTLSFIIKPININSSDQLGFVLFRLENSPGTANTVIRCAIPCTTDAIGLQPGTNNFVIDDCSIYQNNGFLVPITMEQDKKYALMVENTSSAEGFTIEFGGDGDIVDLKADSLALVALYNSTGGNNWINNWDLSMPIDSWYGVTLTTSGCVEKIELSNNNLIGSFPDLRFDSLTVLNISQNSIRNLAELTGMPSLQNLNIANNFFTFDDLIPNESKAENYSYTPQKNVNLFFNRKDGLGCVGNFLIFENQSIELLIEEDEELNLNNYSWRRNDIVVEEGNNREFSITNVNEENGEGDWLCIITNDLLPDLTLITRPSSVRVSKEIPLELILAKTNGQKGEQICIDFQVNGFDSILVYQFPIEWDTQQLDYLEIRNFNSSISEGQSTVETEVATGILRHSWFDKELKLLTLPSKSTLFQVCFTLKTNIISSNDLSINIPTDDIVLEFYSQLENNVDECINPTFSFINQCRERDSLALVALWNATHENGPWINEWDLNMPMDNWHGVELNSEGCVEILELDDAIDLDAKTYRTNNMEGEIPEELASLRDLRFFSVSGNQLRGDLFSIATNWNKIENIGFWNSRFEGEIPSSIGDLSLLKQLTGSSFFRLTANLNDICRLDSLEELYFSSIRIADTIPNCISDLENLTSLGLSSCNLKGKIPVELSKLQDLNFLSLGGNQLEGEIPKELVQLQYLTSLLFEDNQLTGPIPEGIGLLQDLQELDLSTNQLTGQIPLDLQGLQNLRFLRLTKNQLSGNIPIELGQLQNLQKLDLSINQFEGGIPKILGTLEKLEELNLRNNLLTGDVPEELGNLIQLTRLWLHNNKLSGTLPQQLGELTNLINFRLHSNNLSSPISSQLSNLTNLQELTLQNNNFTYEDFSIFSDVSNLTVGPQKPFFKDTTYVGIVNNPLEINLAIDKNLNNNEYEWNKNEGAWAPDAANNLNTNRLIFPSIQPTDAGTYNAMVTNPDFPEAILESYPINIQVCNAEEDSMQLVLLYNATNGDGWANNDNWLSDQPIEDWYGINTNDFGCVGTIDLRNNNLTGTLPALNFNTLDTLILANNAISSTLPDLQLPLARVLDLSYNQLNGSIPSTIGGLIKLRVLNLSHNNLTNTIPPDIGDLCDLEELRLNNNMFDGLLPIEIIQLHNLQKGRVDFSDNMIETLVEQHAFLCPFGDSILMSNPGFDRFLSICNVKCVGDEWEMLDNFPWIADTLSTLDCPDNNCAYSYTQSGYVTIRGIEVIYTRSVCYTRLDPAEFLEIVNFYDCGGHLLESVTYTQEEYIALYQAIPQMEFELLEFTIKENCGQQARNSFTTSIKEVEVTDKVVSKTVGILPLKVFPNPTNEAIHFHQEADMDLSQMRCTNLWGQSIPFEVNNSGEITTLVFDNQPSGLYLLSIQGAERVYLTKFIKL